LYMVYEHTNSKGIKYFLNTTIGGKNKKILYYFSKDQRTPVDMPEGFEVIENPVTKLPVLRKKR